ncbi:uncharacterized protein LOC7484342 [Populus trichocarpa]|uniref:uncharacterized protein LOC7484342 n=1 Tax=Populus trichocarpa TaxID=3694 RepID=UPI002279DA49|nr:uncharacterized protein LOC7484342 [Populus trichocarpa]
MNHSNFNFYDAFDFDDNTPVLAFQVAAAVVAEEESNNQGRRIGYRGSIRGHNIVNRNRKEELRLRMKKSSKSNTNPKSEVRKDSKSGTGLSGSPKKGGHGGKFTWVGDGYSQAEIGFEKEAVDVKDPNFEDPEEIQTV